ncbi:MAG: PAS domain-containing protein [Candidatus Dormiibacterota bacterium]
MTPDEFLPDASAADATPHGSNRESAAHERWFRTLVANSSDLIAVLDDHARVLYANPSAERMLGFIPAERVGRGTFKLIHPDDRDAITTAFREGTHQPGIHRSVVFRFKTASGDWRSLEAVGTNCLGDPAIAGIVVNARDITEQTHLSRALRTLTQGNQVVVRATDEASLLADACETIVAAGYLLAWVGYAEHDSAHTVRPVASAGRTEYLKRIRVSWGDDELGSGLTGPAIRTRSVQLVKDMRRLSRLAPWRAAIDKYGFRTSCAFPLIVSDEAIGALMIYGGEVGAFDPASVAALSEFAADLAYGIGRLRDAALLRKAQAITHVGHWQWNLTSGRINWLADEMFAIHGIAPEQWRGTREALLDLVHPDDRASVMEGFDRMLSGDATDLEHRIVRPNGDIRYVCERVEASRGAQAGHILGVCQDVTEAKVAAIALEHANEELRFKTDQARSSLEKLRTADQQRRRLLGAIVSAQEAERRRVAADVHDDSIQMLAAAVIRLGSIRNKITDPVLSAKLGEFSSVLSRSIDSLRHLVFELRPPSLDRHGLDVAFRESLLEWAAEESVSFTVTSNLAAQPSTEERVVLFRIGQEALNNVRKHARARSVSVSLEEVAGGIQLRVVDDGVGFPSGPSAANGARHFGVANMRERAEQAGGWLRIVHPPSGTVVEAWIPINRVPELTP